MMNAIKELEKWFHQNCDGDWEHATRVKITNLDNPGWTLAISLEETILENKNFDEYEYREENTGKWLYCNVNANTYYANCDSLSLENAILKFLEWKTELEKD